MSQLKIFYKCTDMFVHTLCQDWSQNVLSLNIARDRYDLLTKVAKIKE